MAIVVPTPNTTITSAWGKSVADALNMWPTPGAGAELVYAQVTTNVALVNTTPASSHLFVDGGARTYDGAAVSLELFCPYATSPSAGVTYVGLFDGSTHLAVLGQIGSSAGIAGAALHLRYRFTPAAGSHTYRVGAWNSVAGGQLQAGTGTGGAIVPGFLRITRA